MNENKKTFKVEGVEKFSFMTFVRKNKDNQPIFFTISCTSDMVTPLPEIVAKCIENSGQKWLDVWFVKKNREACHNAIDMKDRAKYTIEKPTKVWITKNARGYLGFIIECAPESIKPYQKEANKDDAKVDTDDLPF